MACLEFIAGRMLCENIRFFLDKCRFKGMNIIYMESKGLFERNFIVNGESDDLEMIRKSINEWVKDA